MAELPKISFKRGTETPSECECHRYYGTGEDTSLLKEQIRKLEAELAFEKRMNARHRELAGRKKRRLAETLREEIEMENYP